MITICTITCNHLVEKLIHCTSEYKKIYQLKYMYIYFIEFNYISHCVYDDNNN